MPPSFKLLIDFADVPVYGPRSNQFVLYVLLALATMERDDVVNEHF
jgi:hypothetical protein